MKSLPLAVKLMAVITTALAVAGALIAAHLLVRGAQPVSAAPVGAAVAIPGGQLRVERVIVEHMAPMHGQASGPATLTMSGMDMAPAGYRRFTVELDLSAQAAGGLRVAQENFQLSAEGMPAIGPLHAALGGGFVPQGSRASLSLTFQVPESARSLGLAFAGGERAVAIELPAADAGGDPAQDHHHGPEQQAPHQHDDHDH